MVCRLEVQDESSTWLGIWWGCSLLPHSVNTWPLPRGCTKRNKLSCVSTFKVVLWRLQPLTSSSPQILISPNYHMRASSSNIWKVVRHKHSIYSDHPQNLSSHRTQTQVISIFIKRNTQGKWGTLGARGMENGKNSHTGENPGQRLGTMRRNNSETPERRWR